MTCANKSLKHTLTHIHTHTERNINTRSILDSILSLQPIRGQALVPISQSEARLWRLLANQRSGSGAHQMGASLLVLRSGALNCRLILGGVVKPHPPGAGPTPRSMSGGGGRGGTPERGRLW